MSDINDLRARGIAFRALVNSSGVAVGGSADMPTLRARGMQPVCQVTGAGISSDSGETIAVLSDRGIPIFCALNEAGIDAGGTATIAELRDAGILGLCPVDVSGVALGGSATVAQLRQRGVPSFCPLDEAGNATTLVADVTPPVISTPATTTIAENTALALPLQADDFSIWTITGGADSTYFDVQTGVFPRLLIWKAPFLPDYDVPVDAGLNNTYVVQVTATSAGGSTNHTVTVTVTDIVDETAPVITSSATVSNTENTVLAHSLTATDVSAVTWSIRPGDDASHFTLTGTTLSWTSGTKDFEDPSHGPSYVVTVRATDAVALFSEQTITVTVTDVAELPPVNAGGVDAPDISGIAAVGATLHLDSPGTWLGSPTITFTYQWYRVAEGEVLTTDEGETLTDDDGEALTT